MPDTGWGRDVFIHGLNLNKVAGILAAHRTDVKDCVFHIPSLWGIFRKIGGEQYLGADAQYCRQRRQQRDVRAAQTTLPF